MNEARIYLDAQVQVRRDIEANWTAVDPVLRDGEIAYSRDVNRIKIGDGAHKWSELKYMLSIDSPNYDDIDLSGYYTKEEADAIIKSITDHISAMWYIDAEGNLVTTMPVMVKNNVIATGEVSAGGAGEVGEDEEGGTTGEYKMYHYKQTEPSTEWNIVHGLGKFPNVKIIDSNRQLCFADVIYEDTNTVLVRFGAAESGDAYLD